MWSFIWSVVVYEAQKKTTHSDGESCTQLETSYSHQKYSHSPKNYTPQHLPKRTTRSAILRNPTLSLFFLDQFSFRFSERERESARYELPDRVEEEYYSQFLHVQITLQYSSYKLTSIIAGTRSRRCYKIIIIAPFIIFLVGGWSNNCLAFCIL